MAMSNVHQNFVSRSASMAKQLLDLYGELVQLNTLWAGTPNYQSAITQEMLDAVNEFSGAGLTLQTLADSEYILAQILNNLQNALPALSVLAEL